MIFHMTYWGQSTQPCSPGCVKRCLHHSSSCPARAQGVIGRLRRFLPVLPTTLRILKWVLLVTVPRTVLDDAARLRTASVRQDQRQYCVLTAFSRSERWYIY